MQIEFDYYTTAQTPIDCAKWLAFIRLYAYVRTPACIYSKILMPSSKQIWRNVHVIPVPDYISNLLATFLKEISAREAALDLEKLPVSDQSMLKDLYIEHGVVRYNSTFKPRDLGPYGLSRYAVVRLGATCVGHAAAVTGCEPALMEKLLVGCVRQLARLDQEPAALWPDEVSWLARAGYGWEHGVLFGGCDESC